MRLRWCLCSPLLAMVSVAYLACIKRLRPSRLHKPEAGGRMHCPRRWRTIILCNEAEVGHKSGRGSSYTHSRRECILGTPAATTSAGSRVPCMLPAWWNEPCSRLCHHHMAAIVGEAFLQRKRRWGFCGRCAGRLEITLQAVCVETHISLRKTSPSGHAQTQANDRRPVCFDSEIEAQSSIVRIPGQEQRGLLIEREGAALTRDERWGTFGTP